jgi:hypothetical protein
MCEDPIIITIIAICIGSKKNIANIATKHG